jgi:hypothetical protein
MNSNSILRKTDIDIDTRRGGEKYLLFCRYVIICIKSQDPSNAAPIFSFDKESDTFFPFVPILWDGGTDPLGNHKPSSSCFDTKRFLELVDSSLVCVRPVDTVR